MQNDVEVNEGRRVPFLCEMASGEVAARYGVLPIVPLPQNDELVCSFVDLMAEKLRDKPIFRKAGGYAIERDGELIPLKRPGFVAWSQSYVLTARTRYDQNGDPYTELRDPTKEVVDRLLDAIAFEFAIREVKEVLPVPMPDQEGNLRAPGYADGFWTQPFEPYYEWELGQAVSYLRELLQDFPFADWVNGAEGVRRSRSLAVQIAAMLAVFCKGMMAAEVARMGFLYDANCPRVGKSLLAKIALIPVHGACSPQGWPDRNEELKKVIDAVVMEGGSYLFLDNVRRFMQSTDLELLMSGSSYAGRVLSKTQTFVAENRVLVFLTANQGRMGTDLGQRFLRCELHSDVADAQSREVARIIDDAWLKKRQNRVNILSALWAIVRAWRDAGSPVASSFGCRPWRGFEQWSEVIGGMVAFAGFGNCLERPSEEEASMDPEGADFDSLLELLVAREQSRRIVLTFQEIVNLCHENDLFDWALEGKAVDGVFELTKKSRASFARILSRYAPNAETKAAMRHRVKNGESFMDVFMGALGKNRAKRFFLEIPSRRS